jgi:diguanylate cyclase (GGDEF)-like protein/PAS domain S-box-containing protein
MDGGQESGDPREARDRARAILKAVDAAYVLSLDGEILEVSDALCRLMGYVPEELVGLKLPWPFWPPEGMQAALNIRDTMLARGFQAGPSEAFEVPLMHRDGTRFVGEVHLAPALLADGTVLGWVSTVRDVSQRKDYEVELERLATQDPLTGLANRRLFEQRLDEEIADAIRHQRPLAVAILDLDHFKMVNDRHGHPAGDDVLKQVARRLGAVLRKGDLLARVGGEEFGWILPEIYAEGAFVAAERARQAISAEPFSPAGEVTISIGVALRGDISEPPLLYQHADEALYRAKHEGRNRTIVWEQPHNNSLGTASQ